MIVTASQARRTALRASGLGRPLTRTPQRRDLAAVVRSLGAVQIDSVNVVARAHLVPFYSRLGPYEVALLERGLERRPLLAVEYWAHEASLVDPTLLASLRWRMARAGEESWGSMSAVARRRPELLEAVVLALARRPLTARELQARLEPAGQRRRDSWGWNWSEVKSAVEFLFWAGRVTTLGRTRQFERRYTLPERAWPPTALAPDPPPPDEAVRTLVDRAASACGVATIADLRDHFRLPAGAMAGAVGGLVAAGRLTPVQVRGWDAPAFAHITTRIAPRRAPVPAAHWATCLLSPFDPLVWTRPRAERLFAFPYRLEIYVPRAQRRHGYYVLPFLLRGEIVARVDLRADRPAGVMEVHSAWVEPAAPDDTAQALAIEMRRFARWCGLGTVAPAPGADTIAGDLGTQVLAALIALPP